MMKTSKYDRFKGKIICILNYVYYKYYLNLILEVNKKSIQIQQNDLPLCDLILLQSNTTSQAQASNREDKTKCDSQE